MKGQFFARVLLVFICMGWSSIAFSAEAGKIGFVDAQQILDNTKAGKKAKTEMEEYVKSRQKIIDIDSQEIKRIDEELSKQAAILSPEAKKSKEEELQRKILKYQEVANRLNKEIQEKRAEVLKEFNGNLERVLKKIGEKNGYTLIFDREEGGVLLFAKEGLDLTQQAIEEYDKMFP